MSATRKRAVLRAILRLLIAERSDADLLYIPHGEAGQRRMIAALMQMRPAQEDSPQLHALLCELQKIDQGES